MEGWRFLNFLGLGGLVVGVMVTVVVKVVRVRGYFGLGRRGVSMFFYGGKEIDAGFMSYLKFLKRKVRCFF